MKQRTDKELRRDIKAAAIFLIAIGIAGFIFGVLL
jgi:preprotein translocase subunit Sss1